jgi:hypothetical protein
LPPFWQNGHIHVRFMAEQGRSPNVWTYSFLYLVLLHMSAIISKDSFYKVLIDLYSRRTCHYVHLIFLLSGKKMAFSFLVTIAALPLFYTQGEYINAWFFRRILSRIFENLILYL